MFKRLHHILCLLCLVAPPAVSRGAGDPNEAQPTTPIPNSAVEHAEPFFDARTHTAEYSGPGREMPAPEDIEEIKIGWFGPPDPNHAKAGAMWWAAELAVEEANLAGGYNGLPFRLIASWSDNPWGTGIKDVVRLAYDQGVWGIVGAPDGPSAHLVEQVVAKARLVFLSPVSTDVTTNLVNVPWIFSCAPSDDILAASLANALVNESSNDRTERAADGMKSRLVGSPRGSTHRPKPAARDEMPRGSKPATAGKGVAVVSFTDHDSRVFTTELLAALRKIDAFPALHLQLDPANTDFATALERIRRVRPAAITLIAGPEDAGRFLTALRAEGLTVPVFGGPAMGSQLFVETAGRSAEGAVFPVLWDTSSAGDRSVAFAQRFRERFGFEPDYTAAYTYDAANLLIAAIRQAGLNRARIRDAVRNLSPWEGVTGTITWDRTGRNHQAVQLGTIRGAGLHP